MNDPSGARVGVSVGVAVRVGLALGIGDAVEVGVWLTVGNTVEVMVGLRTIVWVGVGFSKAGPLHATSSAAMTIMHGIYLNCLFFIDGEERVMIIDLPMRKSKGVISIPNETLV